MRILYVDDDRDIRDIVKLALALDGQIESRIFESGIDAIAMLNSDAWRPDLVLLDVALPDRDGFWVCRALKTDAATSKIPVVMLTAMSLPSSSAVMEGVVWKPMRCELSANSLPTALPDASKTWA